MPKQIKIAVVLLLAAVGGGYLAIRPFAGGGERMKSFCGSLTPGMSLSQAQSLVTAHGYKVSCSPREGHEPSLVIDTRAMGRFICKVRSEEDRVVSTEYVDNP
ncbi:MAG TPA: hypothetical protein VJ860_20675 [Polyangia bacterium]|nr:hypothetical protein [Polyangia bacterium]